MESVDVYADTILQNWADMGVLRMIFASDLPYDHAVELLEHVRASLPLPAGPLVSSGGVALSLQGPVLTIHGVDDEDLARALLSGLGQGIADRGVVGVIDAVPRLAMPVNNPAADMSGFVAGMCLQGRDDVERPVFWHTPEVVFTAVIDAALEWCNVPDGTYYVSSNWSNVTCTAEQRRDLICTSFGIQEPLASILCATGPEHIRVVQFGSTGTVFFGRRDPDPAWGPAVADLSEVLTRLADHIQYGAVTRANMDSMRWDDFVEYGQPKRPYLRSGYAQDGRTVADSLVPDAFAAQLLGPRHHLPPLGDPWLLRPAGRSSTLLIHRELAARIEGEEHDAGILEQARTDLAPVLLTTAAAAQAKKAQWAKAAPPVWNPFI